MLDWLKSRVALLAEIKGLRESLRTVKMQREAAYQACDGLNAHLYQANDDAARAKADTGHANARIMTLASERNALIQRVEGDRNNKLADLVKARVLLAEIDRLKAAAGERV